MDEIHCGLEWREDETRASPGRLVGTIMTYETRALDRPEVFVKDALTWPENGITLNLQHNRMALVGRAHPFTEGNEVKIDAQLPNTSAARDAVELVKTGVVTGLSIEFNSQSEGRRGPLREIRRALVASAALVDNSSHTTAVEVREGLPLPLRRWWN